MSAVAALFNAVLDVEARAGPSESHISRAKSSIFTCICLQCDISTSVWARRVGPTRQGPGCPLQGIGLANMIVCPMTLQYRMASWTGRQSGTMEVGKTPTTENLPRIADLGAPSSTHGVLVTPATRAPTSGASWAPTCKFHHPSRNRKPRVSIRLIHASLPGSRVRPCTVIVRDTPMGVKAACQTGGLQPYWDSHSQVVCPHRGQTETCTGSHPLSHMMDEGCHLRGPAAKAICSQGKGGQCKITCRRDCPIEDIGKIRPSADNNSDKYGGTIWP